MTIVRHSAALTRRELTHWRREPWAPLFSIGFSLLMLLMFGYLWGGAVSIPSGGDYFSYLVPGILTLSMLFGLESTMTSVALDSRRGITDRLRSLPICAVSVPLARSMADIVSSVVQIFVLVGAGLVVGWRPHAGPLPALTALGLLLWLRLAMIWVGIYLGLRFRSEQAAAAIQVLVWPVAFLSGVFVPVSTMPTWLAAIAAWNPVSATAAAVRALCGNPSGDSGAPLIDHAALAFVWPALILAVAVPLTTHAFRKLDR